MQYLNTYLKTISDRGNAKLAESIAETADDIGTNHIRNFSFSSHETGLLFGNVQSGKTGQMFGIICKAADLGFPAFVLLTTDNIALQQQTLERVRNDLDGFCICGENDSGLFIQNSLTKPAIVVLKKNARILRLWANVFASTGFMKGNPLFIVDDEADAASLNTLVNRGRQSSINKYLGAIKDGASSSIYLQVTGTPQAILLQTLVSGWRPYFTYYFKPGDGYLGGDFFFPESGIPQCISFTDNLKDPIKSVVLHHLAVSAQTLISGRKVCSCLIHPSVRQMVHLRFQCDIEKELQSCADSLSDPAFIKELQNVYDQLKPQKSELAPFDAVRLKVSELLSQHQVKVLVMNGATEVSGNQYETGSNIIIGGNTLGRGITFPGLQTICYTRTAKKPQADTMWQHSRMFGYDRDAGLMRVFIDRNLYKLFSDINSTNNSIISQIEHKLSDIRIYYPAGLNPTRRNVLDNKKVGIISGGTNYYPFAPDNDSIERLDQLLAQFDDAEKYYQVSLRLMKEILSHITSEDDFRISAFMSIIDSFTAEKPSAQGILIVRRNRNVAKGTGALLSPNDWRLGESIQDRIVMTVYQMTGEKGWNGRRIWVPNIKLPSNIVYYDVSDEDSADDSLPQKKDEK